MPEYKIKSDIIDLDFEHMTSKIIIKVKDNSRDIDNIFLDKTFRKYNNDILKIYKLNSPLKLIQEDEEGKVFKAKNISKINGDMFIYYDKQLNKYFELEVSI